MGNSFGPTDRCCSWMTEHMSDDTNYTGNQLDQQMHTVVEPLRRSPFYEQQRQLNGDFVNLGDWHSPNWYGENEHLKESYDGATG